MGGTFTPLSHSCDRTEFGLGCLSVSGREVRVELNAVKQERDRVVAHAEMQGSRGV